MILAAGKHGLGLRDIAPVITFFVPDEYRLHRRLFGYGPLHAARA